MTIRTLGFVAWAALLLLQPIWHVWLVPPATSAMLPTLLLSVVPLLLPLLALRQARRALLWAAIVSLFYFSHGIAEVWSHPHLRLLGCIEIALSTLVILAAGFDGRRKKPQKLDAAKNVRAGHARDNEQTR